MFLFEIGLQAQDVKRIDIASFNEVSIGGSFKVEITDDNNEQILLTGDQKAIDEIEVSLRNNKLQIEKKRNSWWRSGYKGGGVSVQIPATQLKAVYLSGSGSLSGTINAVKTLNLLYLDLDHLMRKLKGLNTSVRQFLVLEIWNSQEAVNA